MASESRILVPPTPYSCAVRAELFFRWAEEALSEGRKDAHAKMMVRATYYQELAEQLPLIVYDNRTEKGMDE